MVDLHNPNVIGTLTGVDLGSSNKIEQGDTNVTVTDIGTGLLTAAVDGAQVLNFTDDTMVIGGTRANLRNTLHIDNSDTNDLVMSMGSLKHYYMIHDDEGGEGGSPSHEWFVSENSAMRFDGLTQYFGDYQDTYVKVQQGSNEVEINNGSVCAVFGTGGAQKLYHSGAQVCITTANGLSGVVWG